MECGDQGYVQCFSYSFTWNKETQNPNDVLAKHKAQIPKDLKTDPI
jgi:hypothetical protein